MAGKLVVCSRLSGLHLLLVPPCGVAVAVGRDEGAVGMRDAEAVGDAAHDVVGVGAVRGIDRIVAALAKGGELVYGVVVVPVAGSVSAVSCGHGPRLETEEQVLGVLGGLLPPEVRDLALRLPGARRLGAPADEAGHPGVGSEALDVRLGQRVAVCERKGGVLSVGTVVLVILIRIDPVLLEDLDEGSIVVEGQRLQLAATEAVVVNLAAGDRLALCSAVDGRGAGSGPGSEASGLQGVQEVVLGIGYVHVEAKELVSGWRLVTGCIRELLEGSKA